MLDLHTETAVAQSNMKTCNLWKWSALKVYQELRLIFATLKLDKHRNVYQLRQ